MFDPANAMSRPSVIAFFRTFDRKRLERTFRFGPARPPLAEIALVLLIPLPLMWHGAAELDLHPDEPNSIQTSIAFDAYLNRQWAHPVFRGDLGTTAMPMMRYLAGLGRSLAGLPPTRKAVTAGYLISRAVKLTEAKHWKPWV